jgi:hypothetical protein
MKQIEREMKGEEADATDDEENVLPPTYTDEPHHEFEDRIGSKYASRSRAYVEADHELEDDARRRRFNQTRSVFVAKDEDADDSIEDVTGGFARFAGPNREEAIAHYNLTSMAEAAAEVERTPTPCVEEPEIEVIPNAQAVDLMMLAELSGQHMRDTAIHKITDPYQQSQQPELQLQPQRAATPPRTQELTTQASPLHAPPSFSFPSQAAHSSPIKPSSMVGQQTHQLPQSEPNSITEVSRDAIPARVSTHRVMDMLNNDQDVPVFRSRDSHPPQPPPQEPSTPSKRKDVISQHNTPSHDAASAPDTGADNGEHPVDQALMDALGGRPSEPPSPPATQQPWSRPSATPAREAEDAPRRRDPLQKIRELLDRKAREHGREPPDRSLYRFGNGPATPAFLPRMSSMQTAQDRQDVAGYDPTRPSAGFYPATSSGVAPSYPTVARRESQDYGSSHWDHGRRMSGSQAPQQSNQSPYSNPAQPHQGEHHRTASASSSHQSPYALPPGSLPLPPKPPGPPPPPVNFRFAHYDPAPPRPSYPPPSPTYAPSSHPPPLGPPPAQYPSGYHPSYQGGYVPPPGSFQAPPPPPSLSSYPPLKIHQYGGQPILPANMAPPPHAGPLMAYHGQQGPPPPSAYSPPQLQPPRPQYEAPREEQSRERPPEPQQRPRRQYRSYHAPGTQFRSYLGPNERRRNGS